MMGRKGLAASFVLYFLLVPVLTLLTVTVPGAAGTVDANLKITLIEQEPYPAEIGQYMDLTVQVQNTGRDWADDITIKLVPEYPFSLDSQTNAVKNIGALAPEKVATREYYIYVDKTAKKGTRSIDILYRTGKGAPWVEESYDIRIGTETFDSKGTLELEEVNTEPSVFMPGDSGTVALVLVNKAEEPTVMVNGGEYDTNARVQAASLTGTDDVDVKAGKFEDMGILGPGDRLELTYNIEVAREAKDGTHSLALALEGSSFDYNSKKDVPLEVDSAGVRVIPSKPLRFEGQKATLEFDVVNIHPGPLSSVSIRPRAEGIEFSPLEYFIGPMDPDELFTIEFEAEETGTGQAVSAPSALRPENPEDSGNTVNLSLTASYNNGHNRHEEVVSGLQLRLNPVPGKKNGESNYGKIVALALAIPLIFALGIIYRRRKLKKPDQ